MIIIDSDFENGSLDRAIRLGENWYHLKLRPDTWYWFHCRIKGCKGREITFELTCADISYRAPGYEAGKGRWDFGNGIYNRPVVSYDQKKWQRVDFVEKDSTMVGTFRFRHTFTEDEAYICYSHPYTYTDLKSYLQRIKDNPLIKIETLGKTRNGIAQPILTITKNKKNKKLVLLIFREDADEVTTSFAAEGLINHLLDKKDKKVNQILEKYIFKIVPMVSIDGVIVGATYSAGYGYGGFRWHESPAPKEIENIKEATKRWVREGYKMVVAGKIHGGQQLLSDMPKRRPDIIVSEASLRDVLVSTKDKYWNPIARDLAIRPRGYFERYLLDEFGFKICFGTHVQGGEPDDAKKCGKGLAKAIIEYLKIYCD